MINSSAKSLVLRYGKIQVLRGSDFLPGLLKSGIMMYHVQPFETILDLSRPHCTLENVLVICRAVSDALQEFG